ncbi:hypothetical protein GGR57DRAFT_505394 [Xylariaceae sp. FL1272]|nr:hypothetical protein GGR57DRAFT_505394 [Xylariaceae sp. FL1272]
MTKTILFCIADEAKAFVPKVLRAEATLCPNGTSPYRLAESRRDLPPGKQMRDQLKEGEEFDNDFIGASPEECGAWLLEQQAKVKYLDEDCMVILDARSSQDETVTYWQYIPNYLARYMGQGLEANVWYSFRVPYLKVGDLAPHISPTTADPDETFGVYFWRKDELTDNNGIFDVDKALDLCIRGQGLVPVPEGEQKHLIVASIAVKGMVCKMRDDPIFTVYSAFTMSLVKPISYFKSHHKPDRV